MKRYLTSIKMTNSWCVLLTHDELEVLQYALALASSSGNKKRDRIIGRIADEIREARQKIICPTIGQ